MKIISKITAITLALVLGAGVSHAQNTSGGTFGSYSPYSSYGIGDLSNGGTAYNQSMGGVGIATRNKRYISFINPASITCRDSLSFMADFGLENVNSIYTDKGAMSANNTFNMHNIVMTFPIWRSSAFAVGFVPYSNMGYEYSSVEKDPAIIGNTGAITSSARGQGTLNEMFLSGAATFWNRFSVGAQYSFLFGNFSKYSRMEYSSSSYSSDYSGYDSFITASSAKFGLQYEARLSKSTSMILGATYRMSAKLSGDASDYLYSVHTSASIVDTLSQKTYNLGEQKLRTGDEIGVGVALKVADRLNVEFNYLRGNWASSGFDSFDPFSIQSSAVSYASGVSQSFRAGVEWVPNRNDIRYYYKRMSYRAGAYFNQSPYMVNGKNTANYGITAGITLPVFRFYNGISFGIDLGRNELPGTDLLSQNYFKFVIGFNIHDYWFHKSQYN